MGQRITLLRFGDDTQQAWTSRWSAPYDETWTFPDLKLLPPEIGLKILSNVDAKDLRLVKEFWADLAEDDFLWKRMCYSQWGFCSAYKTPQPDRGQNFWKSLFNDLEAATECFNQRPSSPTYCGLEVFQSVGALNDDPDDVARFIINTDLLKTKHVVELFKCRYDVLESYIKHQNFIGWFLPIALRSFFFKLSISTKRASVFIVYMLEVFSEHYCRCNPLFNADAVLIVVHSLILLSNDLSNPSIKNKMSKREYIKNTMQALSGTSHAHIDIDYLGHSYDNVYLIGHVAPERQLEFC